MLRFFERKKEGINSLEQVTILELKTWARKQKEQVVRQNVDELLTLHRQRKQILEKIYATQTRWKTDTRPEDKKRLAELFTQLGRLDFQGMKEQVEKCIKRECDKEVKILGE